MIVGLTYTGSPEKHQYYVDWLSRTQDVEIIKLSSELNNDGEILRCDGLVLSGGKDIHPSWYGNTKSDYPGSPQTFDQARDEFEMKLFNTALERRMPVLGICRGMQLINTACKGTLIQDLGANELNATHRGNPDKLHEVRVMQPSLLFDISGTGMGQINSAHHQAIENTGEGLIANAVAQDGTIEGLEWEDQVGKAFLLAVQWHPERMFRFGLENTPLSKNILDRFLREIKKNFS